VGRVVDTLLPLSLVLALSPVPVITVVLFLLADGVAHTSAVIAAAVLLAIAVLLIGQGLRGLR
jgi:hypothetical protein